MSNLLPYTGTKGHPDMSYCQLDEVELWDTESLRNHANKLVLTLQARLEKSEVVLSFYMDYENYGSDDKSRATGNDCYDIILCDFDRNINGKDYAGKKAREYFADKEKGK